ncbi:unnamed protein product [Amoebophrya sp. A25]|nr:unnamed protein product [Amoebophrya sp. A25]|eukprot:GSA25T00026298001.1
MSGDVSHEQLQEVFNLFDPDQEGVKIKDIGTLLRAVGLNPSPASLQAIQQELLSSTAASIDFGLFAKFAERVGAEQTASNKEDAASLDGVLKGSAHYYDKVFPSAAKLGKVSTISVKELAHLLTRLGERFSDEEIEDLTKEIRKSCTVEGGRVNFEEVKRVVL